MTAFTSPAFIAFVQAASSASVPVGSAAESDAAPAMRPASTRPPERPIFMKSSSKICCASYVGKIEAKLRSREDEPEPFVEFHRPLPDRTGGCRDVDPPPAALGSIRPG